MSLGTGPSAVYVVENTETKKTVRLRISDYVFEQAHKGKLHHQNKICLHVRRQIESDFGGFKGFVYWDKLAFTKVRRIPSAAKRVPMMRPANSGLKRHVTMTLTSRR